MAVCRVDYCVRGRAFIVLFANTLMLCIVRVSPKEPSLQTRELLAAAVLKQLRIVLNAVSHRLP